MNVRHATPSAASIAAAIGEPARARMLFTLLDGRARTTTELSTAAGVTASTASVHVRRLVAARLVTVVAQGRHRYCRLQGAEVATALEALSVLAHGARPAFVPGTPSPLLAARTCYDHIAGTLGVALHDRFRAAGWLVASPADPRDYEVTPAGRRVCASLDIDVDDVRAARRRFAFGCLDWSERRPHVGGALGAAILKTALRRRWVARDVDSRALRVTAAGRRGLVATLGLAMAPPATSPRIGCPTAVPETV